MGNHNPNDKSKEQQSYRPENRDNNPQKTGGGYKSGEENRPNQQYRPGQGQDNQKSGGQSGGGQSERGRS